MPIVDCPSCGHKTNTATCTGWWDVENRAKAKCVARLIPKDGGGFKYERGCGYDDASRLDRIFADDVIKDSEI